MLDPAALIASVTGNQLLTAVILGMLPISEVRGAAIYAFSINQHWLILPAMLANIAVAPLILLFWNFADIPFWGRLFLGKRLEDRLLKIGRQYEVQGPIAIALFIGVPLPFTGVYTGTLIAELLGMKRLYTLFAVIAGVVMAASIMYISLKSAWLVFS